MIDWWNVFTNSLWITGLAVAGGIGARHVEGASIAVGYLKGEYLSGLGTGAYNRFDHVEGLQIGIFNYCEYLNGVQIGLLNYAGNNPDGLKLLPGINVNF